MGKGSKAWVTWIVPMKEDREIEGFAVWLFRGREELARRHDVEVASKGFATEEVARAEIERPSGSIRDGFDLLLDFWDEDGKTVWSFVKKTRHPIVRASMKGNLVQQNLLLEIS